VVDVDVIVQDPVTGCSGFRLELGRDRTGARMQARWGRVRHGGARHLLGARGSSVDPARGARAARLIPLMDHVGTTHFKALFIPFSAGWDSQSLASLKGIHKS
jgi:hypothetical protein